MKPRHIVIGANAHADLTRDIAAARPDLEIRGNTMSGLTAEDLAWGDTYVGFRRPPQVPTMGGIQWVHCTGAGVDSWLYPVELSRDIMLTRSSESFGPMIAEWALARALAFSQQLIDLSDRQRKHEWAPRDIARLSGTTAVVVGTGDVGTHTGRHFASMGCRVLGVSRSGNGDPSVFSATYESSELAEVVPAADWLILTTPLTAATDGMVSREVLAACRGAVLINAGRGKLVDEASIPVALENGWLRGAALDVFETEPLPATSPLWDEARVMISPHISGITTIDGAVKGFLDSLEEVEAGKTPTWLVDRRRGY